MQWVAAAVANWQQLRKTLNKSNLTLSSMKTVRTEQAGIEEQSKPINGALSSDINSSGREPGTTRARK